MKKKFVLLALGVLLGIAVSAGAAEIKLAWDPNTEPDLAGYRVHYGTASGVYGAPINVGITTMYTLTGLSEGQQYYISVTAYDTSNNQSGYSNEVTGIPSVNFTLDGTYAASAEFTMNANNGVISGNVMVLPADPKLVGWAKDLTPVTSGQIVRINARMLFNNGEAPVSFYLVDDSTGYWASPERVAYVDNSYGIYVIDLIVGYTTVNPRLYVSTGHKTGGYEFQQISVSTITPSITPVTDLYLKQLLPRQLIGLYSAEWIWNTVPRSQGYAVRAALFRDEIEKGADGILLTSQILPPTQTSFRRDIDSSLYGGIYLSVSNISGGEESAPWITWYLPGDVFNTADDDIPPLTFQGKVDAQDANYAYTGYTSARRVPALIPGMPAGPEERTDIDNNTYAGRITDYSFIRSQYLNNRRMQ